MTPISAPSAQRILVIDDNCAIHDDFRKILGLPDDAEAALQTAEEEIFGSPRRAYFEIDSAHQGEEGLRMVEQAMAEGRPYSLAFIDVRMPPGWDGIETTGRIWESCPDLQVVICTAYADCSWNEMHEQLCPKDRLLILKKPFDTIEVLQMANALTEKWRLSQDSKSRLADLEKMVSDRTRDLEFSRRQALDMMEDAVRNAEKVQKAYLDLKHEEEERSKLEEQVRDQGSQLLRSQRMESVGRLACGIAHDLNNILTPILLSGFMLRRQLPPEEFEAVLGDVEKSAQRGAALIRQLLTFGRGAGGQRTVVHPESLIRDMQKLIAGTFPKNIIFTSETLQDGWPVTANATEIHQVLLNLCVNARDAMPLGGRLSLEVQDLYLDQTHAEVEGKDGPVPYVCLRVTDTGEGIPPNIVDKIFDPFFTTKELGNGTGLGLSTVMGIVKSHHGFVSLESKVGEGSTFKIYLPAAPDAVEAKDALPVQTPKAGNGEMILVVDDETGIRTVLQKTLLHHGYRVVCAEDGMEALTQYARHRNDIKAVVTDIMMPAMDGISMARELKRMDPTLKIIAASGMGSSKGRGDATDELATLGVTTFLHKPYSSGEILAGVSALLAQEEPAVVLHS